MTAAVRCTRVMSFLFWTPPSGGQRQDSNGILPHVRKWAVLENGVQNLGVSPLKRDPKLRYLFSGGLQRHRDLSANIFGTKLSRRTNGKKINYEGSSLFFQNRWLWLTNDWNYGRVHRFWPLEPRPRINSLHLGPKLDNSVSECPRHTRAVPITIVPRSKNSAQRGESVANACSKFGHALHAHDDCTTLAHDHNTSTEDRTAVLLRSTRSHHAQRAWWKRRDVGAWCDGGWVLEV